MIISTNGSVTAKNSSDIRFDDDGMAAYYLKVCIISGDMFVKFLGVDKQWSGPYRLVSSNPAAASIDITGEVVYAVRLEATSDSQYSILALVVNVPTSDEVVMSQAMIDEIVPRQLV